MYDLCEELGLYQWTAFVCLHHHRSEPLSVIQARIEDTLGRHTPSWKDSSQMESFFLNDLKIPAVWLMQLKVMAFCLLELPCLLDMGEWDLRLTGSDISTWHKRSSMV